MNSVIKSAQEKRLCIGGYHSEKFIDTVGEVDEDVYINEEGYTMLPLRAVSEALDANVSWDDATKSITVMRGQRVVSFSVGSRNMYINGTVVPMNTSVEIKEYGEDDEHPHRTYDRSIQFSADGTNAYFCLRAACAAARRAIGTRNGEQDT